MFRYTVYLLLLQGAYAGQGNGALRTEGFVRALDFNYKLRMCNAYPNEAALEVFRGKEKLTGEGGMTYKSCGDFETPLKAGDKLEFKVGEASQGTFSVADLPQNDAVLMIAVHRHDIVSTAMSFESHVFANSQKAQVAILDTYKGAKKATPQIEEFPEALPSKEGEPKKMKPQHKEMLRYDSVVGVEEGHYNVELLGDDDSNILSKVDLVALNHESYVVLRVGVEAKTGQEYPQDVIVFPQSDVNKLPHQSGAACTALLAPLMVVAAAFWM